MESSNNSSCMDEIYPGLWIGSIGSLRVYENAYNDLESNRYWTIISLINSEIILQKLVIALDQQQQQQLQEEEEEESSSTSETAGAATPGQQQHLIRKQHVVWRLKDKSNSIFVCERLEEILSIIDGALRIKQCQQHTNEQSHHGMNFNETNSTTINNSCISVGTSSSSSSGEGDDGKEKNNDINNNGFSETSPTSCCLVHCAQGKSRSAAICAAWFISRRGMSLQQSLEVIRYVRPQIQPNLGFIAGLRAIEQSNGSVIEAINRMKKREKETPKD